MKDDKNLVRIGIVSALDPDRMMVRVYYPQFDDLVSGWLPVLQHPAAVIVVAAGFHGHAGSTASRGSHSHGGQVTSDGAHAHPVTIDEDGEHGHEAELQLWMPEINNKVLVLYIQGFSADGFVLGVIP